MCTDMWRPCACEAVCVRRGVRCGYRFGLSPCVMTLLPSMILSTHLSWFYQSQRLSYKYRFCPVYVYRYMCMFSQCVMTLLPRMVLSNHSSWFYASQCLLYVNRLCPVYVYRYVCMTYVVSVYEMMCEVRCGNWCWLSPTVNVSVVFADRDSDPGRAVTLKPGQPHPTIKPLF